MKFAIISDTHDRLDLLKKCLEYLKEKNIPILIHCGDHTKSDVLDLIGKKFNGQIYSVAGNAELDIQELENIANIYPNLKFFKEVGEVIIDNLKIAFTHKPQKAKDLANSGNFDLVLHGHTHTPWQKVLKNTEILNPGNMSDQPFPSTFAIYDSKTRKAKLISIS